MAVVGIDLGTTYSVIATPDAFAGENFESIGGVTIIKDDYKRRLTPSVVAVDRQGNLLVGQRAKARAGQQPEPIMFVKRAMGEAKEFMLGDRPVRPEQVSAEILRHLKDLAEKRLGETVDEAVITVPAYFSMKQKQKTQEAGELAGLKMADPLQEPVAAALAYCHTDTRDPLTIMTYDLGGGTFDVAILRKEQGVFEIKSFDGDPYLGGYDFDKLLAYWIADRLNEHGYQLEIEPENAPQRPIRAKLLVLAERAKELLSDQTSHVLIDQNPGIVDANGEPVSIELEISRESFEGLIEEQIEETIRLCHKALQKANLTAEALDEIVLVGGSSRIPLVARRLEAEFGRKPRLNEPDLSIAIGAAIMAGSLGKRIGALKLGQLPDITTLSSIQITGTLDARQLQASGPFTVVLLSADGSLSRKQPVNEQGGFLIQVPLSPNTNNRFTLRVEDANGREVLSHAIAIRRDASGISLPKQTVAGLPTNVLSKPFAIMTVNGPHIVAPELTALPYECHVQAQTMDQTGEVRVPVYEDNAQIGEVVVTGVPTDLPIGSRVDITLHLRSDYYIDGKAHIPDVDVEGQAIIPMPDKAVKSLDALQNDYLVLKGRAEEALAQADRGQAFGIAPRLHTVLETSRKMLYEERGPELAKVQQLLAEAEALIRQLAGWKPEPPAERFGQIRRAIEEELLPDWAALRPADESGYQAQLNAIVQKGERALQDKNPAAWAEANRQIRELRERLANMLEQEERRRQRRSASHEEPPDPRVIKLKLGLHLTQLREEARRHERLKEMESEFNTCDQTLKNIDAGKPDAMSRLGVYYESQHQPLEAKVSGPMKSREDRGLVQVLLEHGKGS